MSIRKKVSVIIGHVYCAMCGHSISERIILTDQEERAIKNTGKSIRKQIMCPYCVYKTEIVIDKNSIKLKEKDI